ncbi:MAG: Gfo/Idh/MocA family oxidoreductase, partial [Streptosporangiaceae bacterium]|nr:Gfo/Idh/MocA family oxidoreductase [Streptosporangiaceae bacterium]
MTAGLATVGLGRWARVLTRAYSSSAIAELRACFSRDTERTAAFAADFGCDPAASLPELLGRDDIDGIIITAPNDQHAPLIEAAAAAGKHVSTEKPIAVEIADLRRI